MDERTGKARVHNHWADGDEDVDIARERALIYPGQPDTRDRPSFHLQPSRGSLYLLNTKEAVARADGYNYEAARNPNP
eukprot:6174257-Pyramimonas_sp.AAC.1